MKINRSERGFTFVEIAMALLISGMVFMGLMRAFYLYNMRVTYDHTMDALKTSKEGINEYLARRGVYPCPASPSAAPGNAEFGKANCGGANVVRVAGRNGLDVYIGAVPVTTIGEFSQDVNLSYRDTVDGWGNRLTYAVTGILTDPLTYNNKEGAISIIDEFGNTVVEPPAHAHMLVLSHGEDGIGAYSAEGVRAVDCSTITITPPPGGPAVASISEIENCDSDAEFLSGLSNTDPDTYNDDIVNFLVDQVFNLWQYVPGKTNAVTNTNNGNVGLDVKDPQQKLDINGDLNAQDLHADMICDDQGQNCMDPSKIAGEGMSCPAGTVAYAVANNALKCRSLFSGTITGCGIKNGVQEFAVGIRGDGSLICEPPSQ
jgi:hypothetical protein